MGAVYSQLSLQERRRIEDMLNAKIPVAEMADQLATLFPSCRGLLGKSYIGKGRTVQIGDEMTLRLAKPGSQTTVAFYRTASCVRPETLDKGLPTLEQSHDITKADLARAAS